MEPVSVLISIAASQSIDIAKSIAKSLGETFAGDQVKDFSRSLKRRLASQLFVPRNHDLLREIRSAELVSARQIEKAHRAWLARLPRHERTADQPFIDGMDDFLSRRLKLHTDFGIDFQVLTPERIDHVLDEMIDVVVIEGALDTARSSHKAIEEAFLQEIETEIGQKAPPAFLDRFAPAPGERRHGWYDLVALYITEEIKTSERFRSIFFAAELVDIKQLVVEADSRITALQAQGVRSIRADVAEVLSVIHDAKRTSDQTLAEVQSLRALVEKLVAASPAPIAPGAERAIGEAVQAAAQGAEAGDVRLKQALDMLQAGDIGAAENLFQIVADEREARIRQDTRDAAAAHRHRGAIAGLRDPGRALEAYRRALKLDPDDGESLISAGWIELERGLLGEAEHRFRHILSKATGDDRAWYLAWARFGLGDLCVQRGNLVAATVEYRKAGAIAERLAAADPGNAGWQRDLSVSHDRIGNVLVAQGQLPQALSAFRDSLAIRERLAEADPGNAGWQRDLSVSHAKLANAHISGGEAERAWEHLVAGRAIMADLVEQYPEWAQWRQDLAWFDTTMANLAR